MADLSSKTVTVLTAAKITELTTKFPNLGIDTFVHERDYNQMANGREELRQRFERACARITELESAGETPAKPARDADHCDFPDCEQHYGAEVQEAATLLTHARHFELSSLPYEDWKRRCYAFLSRNAVKTSAEYGPNCSLHHGAMFKPSDECPTCEVGGAPYVLDANGNAVTGKPECPKCRTELAFEGDVCGLCQ